jgi:hypothetical protein
MWQRTESERWTLASLKLLQLLRELDAPVRRRRRGGGRRDEQEQEEGDGVLPHR